MAEETKSPKKKRESTVKVFTNAKDADAYLAPLNEQEEQKAKPLSKVFEFARDDEKRYVVAKSQGAAVAAGAVDLGYKCERLGTLKLPKPEEYVALCSPERLKETIRLAKEAGVSE